MHNTKEATEKNRTNNYYHTRGAHNLRTPYHRIPAAQLDVNHDLYKNKQKNTRLGAFTGRRKVSRKYFPKWNTSRWVIFGMNILIRLSNIVYNNCQILN